MKLTTFNKSQKGFTLIELLVVITIISVLLVVVFVALNPGERLAQARDARRTSDVDSILTAIHQYIVDNKSAVPTGLSTSEQQLGTATTGCNTSGECTVGTAQAACLDLSSPTTGVGKYLASIPLDPKTGTAGVTGYSVLKDSNGIVTVKSCGAELTTPIQTSR